MKACRHKTKLGFCKVNYRKNQDGMVLHNKCFNECGGIDEEVNRYLVCSWCGNRYPVQKAYLGCSCERKEDVKQSNPFSFDNIYDIKYL